MVLFASLETERGEWLPSPPLGEGERDRVWNFLAVWIGVDGTELECCETMDGRWARAYGTASPLLLAMFVKPLDVIDA
jgi:hypothetical protein